MWAFNQATESTMPGLAVRERKTDRINPASTDSLQERMRNFYLEKQKHSTLTGKDDNDQSVSRSNFKGPEF